MSEYLETPKTFVYILNYNTNINVFNCLSAQTTTGLKKEQADGNVPIHTGNRNNVAQNTQVRSLRQLKTFIWISHNAVDTLQ